MNKKMSIMAGLLLAAMALPAAADRGQRAPRDPGVNHRQHQQHHRIKQGARSGQLTRGETRRLAHEQRAIRAEERAYKSDGVLTPGERADLQRDLNRSSRHIYREKHDAQHRPGAGNPPPGNPAMRDPGVNARQHRQHDRIRQGIRSGELTKDEVKELAVEQKAIRQEERAYKADGALTREERKDLHQDLNAESKNIHEEKHDSEKR